MKREQHRAKHKRRLILVEVGCLTPAFPVLNQKFVVKERSPAQDVKPKRRSASTNNPGKEAMEHMSTIILPLARETKLRPQLACCLLRTLLMSRSNVPQNGSFLHSQHQQSITHKTFPNLQHTEMTKAPGPVPVDHFQDQSPARWSNRRVLTSTIARPSNVD